MRIKVKNNRNGNIENETVIKVAKFYLAKLMGEDKFKDIDEVTITFKKLVYYRGGYLKTKNSQPRNFWIAVNSKNTLEEQLSTLAHECVHLKQYALKELSQRFLNVGRRGRWVRVWKGKEYLRKAYLKRPWEIEARKYQDTLSANVLNKIDKPVKPKVIRKPIEVKPVVLTKSTCAVILEILKDGAIPNGDLVKRILNGDTSKQTTLSVLREVFAFKQEGFIREVNMNSSIWVELV